MHLDYIHLTCNMEETELWNYGIGFDKNTQCYCDLFKSFKWNYCIGLIIFKMTQFQGTVS